MDLHKQIAEDVRSRADRERAREFLRAMYGRAVRGTEWEALGRELEQQQDPIDEADPIEFYDVEDRGVAVVWPAEGMGSAWVWTHSWRLAPGLVNKSWLEGQQMSRARFRTEFPSADIAALEEIVRDAQDPPAIKADVTQTR